MIVTLIGLFTKPLSYFLPIKPKTWIFGADCGNMYREGSKYLLEYMLKNHPDYQCTFITRNPSVKAELDKKGIPCEMNFSLKGICKVLQAEVVITTQVASDILLVYKKSKRRFYYLGHGQPYKAGLLAQSKEYHNSIYRKKVGIKLLWQKITSFLNEGYDFTDTCLYSSTSDWLLPFNRKVIGESVDTRVLGMPRNDGLFDDARMKSEKWLTGVSNKLIITYMPTHRKYGQGDVSPIPFVNNTEAQQWMRDNNVVFVVKQHPNMEAKVNKALQTDVIIDISKMKFDPQVVLYHTDVLISDFSSVWIDFLLLRRPVLFYFYDRFEKDDEGILYDIREDPPGHYCYTEDELFNLIKKAVQNYDSMRPSDRIVQKFHKYVDGNSCERYYKAIIEKQSDVNRK